MTGVRVTLDTPDNPPVGILQLLEIAKAARAYRAAYVGRGDVVKARDAMFAALDTLDETPR